MRKNDDDASWQVLEDWLLETNDPRARLVRLEKAHRSTALALVELAPLLLGPHAADIEAHEWRAGFARRAIIRTSDLEDAPALAFVRDVTLRFDAAPTHGVSALGSQVESLAIEFRRAGPIDASMLGSLAQLTRLRVRGPLEHIDHLACVPSLESLELEVPTRAVAETIRRNPLSHLRRLTIATGTLLYPWTGVFDRLFDGTSAPNLEELHLDAAPTSGNLDFLRDLAQSRLGARLRRLSLAGTECSPQMLQRFGRSIATTRDAPLREVVGTPR